jgi:dihydrofolate reductase
MRKLKLQVQMSVDGYIAGPNHEMDWMVWDWDEALKKYVIGLHEPVDCILLGRNMVPGFTDTWEAMENDPAKADWFSHKMVDTHKIVFSKTMETVAGKNVVLENGDLEEAVNKLKNQEGQDIIVYGGAQFVSSLIEKGLIDELHLFINPAAIGNGMSIFKDRTKLKLQGSRAFDCGIVAMKYTPVK